MSKYNNMKSIPIDSLNEENLKEKKEIKIDTDIQIMQIF